MFHICFHLISLKKDGLRSSLLRSARKKRMNNKVMPSPSTSMYERSMTALLSRLKGSIEEEKTSTAAPAMDYIVGSFLDSLGTMQPHVPPPAPINYNENMLYLDQFENQDKTHHDSGISEYRSATPARVGSPLVRPMESDHLKYAVSNTDFRTSSSIALPTPSHSPAPILPENDRVKYLTSAISDYSSPDGRFGNMIRSDSVSTDSYNVRRMSGTLPEHDSMLVHANNHVQDYYSMHNHTPDQIDYGVPAQHHPYMFSNDFLQHQIPHPHQSSHSMHFQANYNNESDISQPPSSFRCDFADCNKTFSKSVTFENHRKTHYGEEKAKPFHCDKCPQSFARSHGIFFLTQISKDITTFIPKTSHLLVHVVGEDFRVVML
jgi:hypothetical protein